MGARHVTNFGEHLQAVAKGKLYITVDEPTYQAERDAPDRRYHLRDRKTGKSLGSMRVQSLPGCCGIALFRNFQGNAKGIGQLITFGCEAARRARYGGVLYTLREESPINDFVALGGQMYTMSFVNGKTGHRVTKTFINLEQEAPEVSATESE